VNLVGETSCSIEREVGVGFLFYDSLLAVRFMLLVNDGFEDILEEAVLAYIHILNSFLIFLEKPRKITNSSRM
jgi:hypothetical protein